LTDQQYQTSYKGCL